MTPKIKIKNSDSCSIIIKDLTDYVAEDATDITKDAFKYSETCSVDIILLCKVSDNPEVRTILFTAHDDSNIRVSLSTDGHYKIIHYILPTEAWVEKSIAEGTIEQYDVVYYADVANNQIYLYNPDSSDSKRDWNELTEANSTLVSVTQEMVSVCYIRKCYIDYCKQIFNARAFSSCDSSTNIDSDLAYKRDLLWMAINVIKYLVECDALIEAERYIELLTSCIGLCSLDGSASSNISGDCGCSK